MTHLADIPAIGAAIIAILLILGATLTLIGSLGVLLLRDFYQRLHAPTLGSSWGTGAIALASMLTFSFLRGVPLIHELVIGVFIMITTPIGLLLLGRAACRRDFGEDRPSAERCAAPPETLPDPAEDVDDTPAATEGPEPAPRPAG